MRSSTLPKALQELLCPPPAWEGETHVSHGGMDSSRRQQTLFPFHLFPSWDSLQMPPKIQQQKLCRALEIPTSFPLLFLQSSRREPSQDVPTTLWVSGAFSWALLQASFLLLGRKAQPQALRPLLLAQYPKQAAKASDSPHHSQLSFISVLNKQPNICFRISAGTKALDILNAV